MPRSDVYERKLESTLVGVRRGGGRDFCAPRGSGSEGMDKWNALPVRVLTPISEV